MILRDASVPLAFRILPIGRTTRDWLQQLNRFLWLVTAVCVAPCVAAHAWEGEVDTQRALQSLQRTTWYDSQSQKYLPPKVQPEKDSAIRTSGWEAQPKSPSASWSWDWFNNWSFPGFFSGLGEFFSRMVLIVLVMVLVGIAVGLLYYAFRDYLPQRRSRVIKQRSIEIDPTRIEDLPFDVQVSRGDPLAEAKRLYEAGRYDEAIVYLYGYMLLVLDNARKIHLVKGKTNRMYLREMRSEAPRLRSITELTMLAFEQVYFGKHSISADHFGLLWGQLGEFHELLVREHEKSAGSAVEVAPA